MELLAIAVTASCLAELAVSQSALPSFQCESSGFFPDPNNCAVFYRCVSFWGGETLRPVMFRCKDPAVFDPELNACQFAWRLKPPCVKTADGTWVRQQQTATLLSSVDDLPNFNVLELGTPDYEPPPPPRYRVAAGSPFACPGLGEHFADIAGACVFYYQCVESEPGLLSAQLFRCREGEIFTETTGQCVRPAALPPCGRPLSDLARSDLPQAPVEDDVYDDRDFYLELEFRRK